MSNYETDSARGSTPNTPTGSGTASPWAARAGSAAPSPVVTGATRRRPPRPPGSTPRGSVGAIHFQAPAPDAPTLDLESPTPRGREKAPSFTASPLSGRRPGTPGSLPGTPSKGSARLAAFRPASLQLPVPPGKGKPTTKTQKACLGLALVLAGVCATVVAATAVAGPELVAARAAAWLDTTAPTALATHIRASSSWRARVLSEQLSSVGETLDPLPPGATKGNAYGDDDDAAAPVGVADDDDDGRKRPAPYPDSAEVSADEADWIGNGPHRYVKLYLANPSATGAATIVHVFEGGESVTARLGAREETYQYAQLGDTMEIRHAAEPAPAGEPQWQMRLELFAAPGTNSPAIAFRNPMKGDAFSMEGANVPGRWIGPSSAEAMTVNDGDRFWVKDLQLANRVGVALIYLEAPEQRMAHAMIAAEGERKDDD